MRPKKRGHVERSQPHTRPPSRTPTLRLNPISMPPSMSAGMPSSAPADDAERDEHHVGGVGRAVRRRRCAARRAARRRDGPTSVTTSPRWTTVLGSMATAVPPRVSRRRNTLRANRSVASSASVRPSTAAWVTTTSSTSAGTSRSARSSTSAEPSRCSSIFATSCSRRPVTARTSPSCTVVASSGSSDLVAAPDPLDEEPRVRRRLLELPDPAADERRSGLHGVGAILDVPPCGRDRHEPAAHLLLVAPALLLEVDAHDAGRDLREEPGGADDADQIRDGEGDGNVVGRAPPRRRVTGRGARWRRWRCRWSPTR